MHRDRAFVTNISGFFNLALNFFSASANKRRQAKTRVQFLHFLSVWDWGDPQMVLVLLEITFQPCNPIDRFRSLNQGAGYFGFNEKKKKKKTDGVRVEFWLYV